MSRSVVGNWKREFEKWGYFEVGLYTEGKRERKEVLRDFELGRLDVCKPASIFTRSH
jgi:hypothetical protein